MILNVEDYYPLARSQAHQLCNRLGLHANDRLDALQEAYLGLLLAARDFKPEKSRGWAMFAKKRIRWRLQLWLHRKPVVRTADRIRNIQFFMTPLSLEVMGAMTYEMDFDRRFAGEELLLALQKMSDSNRELLMSRYGIGRGEETLEQIGLRDGVTRQAVGVRQRTAEARLRRLMTA